MSALIAWSVVAALVFYITHLRSEIARLRWSLRSDLKELRKLRDQVRQFEERATRYSGPVPFDD